MVVASLSNKGLSGGCISAQGVFTLCVPDSSLAEQAFYCGTVSGRTEDKAAKANIPLMECEGNFPPAVENSQLILLCRLQQTVPVGDHTLYIAQVEKVYGDSSKQGLKAYDGYRYLK